MTQYVFVDKDRTTVLDTTSSKNKHYPANHAKILSFVKGGGVIGEYSPPTPSTQQIKDEASRRIVAAYSQWKRENMQARATELIDIKIIEGGLSPKQEAELTAIKAVWSWLKSVRTASDALESTLPVDYLDDKYWPGSP